MYGTNRTHIKGNVHTPKHNYHPARTRARAYISIRLPELQIVGRVDEETFDRVDLGAARRPRRNLKLDFRHKDGRRLLLDDLAIQSLGECNRKK